MRTLRKLPRGLRSFCPSPGYAGRSEIAVHSGTVHWNFTKQKNKITDCVPRSASNSWQPADPRHASTELLFRFRTWSVGPELDPLMPTEPAPLTAPLPRPVEISPYKSAKYKKRPGDHVNHYLAVFRELLRTEPKLHKKQPKQCKYIDCVSNR